MIRKKVLETALSLTCGERDSVYGPPEINMECLGELLAVYRKYAVDRHNLGHDACIFQILTKVSRIACGKLKEDNYIDGAAYFGMAYECALKALENNVSKRIDQEKAASFGEFSDLVNMSLPKPNSDNVIIMQDVDSSENYNTCGCDVCQCQESGEEE